MSGPLTKAEFIDAIFERFQARGSIWCDGFWRGVARALRGEQSMSWLEAREQAWEAYETFLSKEGVTYGHPDYRWDRSGAHEIAEEAMSYWETRT